MIFSFPNPFGLKSRSNIHSVDAAKESYTGKEQDVESNLYYFGARYYDPASARWLSVDPLAGKYPSYSPYNYTLNNPVNAVDPDGQFVQAIWGFAIGAAVEMVSQVTTDMIVNDKNFSEAVDDMDWADVGVAAGVGAATGGLTSVKALGSVAKVAISAGASVAEGATKANIGSKTYDYGVGEAIIDGAIGGVAEVAGQVGKKIAQKTRQAKNFSKKAKRLTNIANNGKARPAQAMRAAKAQKVAKSYGSGNIAKATQKGSSAAASETTKETRDENKVE